LPTMPPKRKAAPSAKRPTASAAGTGAPASRRQKMVLAAATAAPAEETTTVEVYGFDKDWLNPLYEMYGKRELTDVVLRVGETCRAVHRVVVATVSPVLRKMFSSGMAESKSSVIELQDVGELALSALVEFAYTGKIALKGSTVVAIIQAANRLQIEAVERAAVDFLVAGLDAGNVLDAMALGAHLAAGKIGRDLQEKSRAWLNKNFGLMAAEPSFLQLPVAEVAAFVESDGLEVQEEEVLAAVLDWVREDEVGRKGELGRLLPLVRFPMMAVPAPAIMEDPLIAGHPLAIQLLYETHPNFGRSAQAAACPRLRPRKEQRLGGLPALPALAFTSFNVDCYTSEDDGRVLLTTERADSDAAVCAGHVMRAGRHAAQFTVIATGRCDYLGLARPGYNVYDEDVEDTDRFWGICSHDVKLGEMGNQGSLVHGGGRAKAWVGQQGFRAGDVVGLLLDCDAGTLTVKKDGVRLGVAATGLRGEFCWAAALWAYAPVRRRVRIAAVDPAVF
jgi:hypothetical protein